MAASTDPRPPPSTTPPNTAAAMASAGSQSGLASGVYRTPEDTLGLAPETGRAVSPGEQASLYEAAYGRYLELYPRLSG